MEFSGTYVWIYTVTQIASLLLFWAAYAAPRLARFLFFLLFAWACCINLYTATQTPNMYMDYAPMALSLYADFINGWFSTHITIMVSCIAIAQGIIAVGMLLKGAWVKLACKGGIVFLLSITPLGLGAGFPFSLTVSAALYLILRKNPDPDYVWNIFPKTTI